MARIELAPGVIDDLDRFFDHMTEFGVEDISQRINSIVEALEILVHNPLIGRPVKGGKRELVIGRDHRGYIALYRFISNIDTVLILAMRSSRERDYKHRV